MEKILLKSKAGLKGGQFGYTFIIVRDQEASGELKVIASADAEAFASAQSQLDGNTIESYVAPPAVNLRPDDPREATETEQLAIMHTPLPSLAKVAASWKKSCILADREVNNCAHYLSDAFIRAGYTELAHGAPAHPPEITIWCDYNDPPVKDQARVIRARETNAWFRSKCEPLTVKPVNKGFFAVFQLERGILIPEPAFPLLFYVRLQTERKRRLICRKQMSGAAYRFSRNAAEKTSNGSPS